METEFPALRTYQYCGAHRLFLFCHQCFALPGAHKLGTCRGRHNECYAPARRALRAARRGGVPQLPPGACQSCSAAAATLPACGASSVRLAFGRWAPCGAPPVISSRYVSCFLTGSLYAPAGPTWLWDCGGVPAAGRYFARDLVLALPSRSFLLCACPLFRAPRSAVLPAVALQLQPYCCPAVQGQNSPFTCGDRTAAAFLETGVCSCCHSQQSLTARCGGRAELHKAAPSGGGAGPAGVPVLALGAAVGEQLCAAAAHAVPRQLDASVATLVTAFPSWSELSIISSVWSFEAFFQARGPGAAAAPVG